MNTQEQPYLHAEASRRRIIRLGLHGPCVYERVMVALRFINIQVFGGRSVGLLLEVFMGGSKGVRVCLAHTTGGILEI